MAAALSVTGIVAYFLSQSPAFWQTLAMNPSIIWIAIIAQLGLVIWLSARLQAMSMSTATLLFILYSVLNGVTMSMIFLLYEPMSIAITFAVTAGMFFATSLIGYITRMDLSKFGSVFMMLLMGIIIGTVVNFFFAKHTVNSCDLQHCLEHEFCFFFIYLSSLLFCNEGVNDCLIIVPV